MWTVNYFCASVYQPTDLTKLLTHIMNCIIKKIQMFERYSFFSSCAYDLL